MTPLPEPAYQRLSDLQSGIDDYYTEQQMRDYGKAEFERGLRAALEQQAEPVAWGAPDALGNIVETISPDEKITDMKAWADQYSVPLYAAPPQRHGIGEKP